MVTIPSGKKSFYRFVVEKFLVDPLRNVRLSLSGEINILASDINRAVMTDEGLFSNVASNLQPLRVSFPELDISLSKDLHELTVKFFAGNSLVTRDDVFLERFQASLIEFLRIIIQDDQFKVRVNFFGTSKSWQQISRFLIVNNGKDVYAKVTESVYRGTLPVLWGRVVDGIFLKNIF